jgi:hypothetical protein
MNTRSRAIAVLAACATLLSLSCSARNGPPGDAGVSFSVEGGYLNQQSTDVDNGGGFSADRYFARAGARKSFANGFAAGISVGGGQDEYKFSGSSGIGGLNPWSKIRNVRISLPLRYAPEGSWSYQFVPSLRYSYEQGADRSDGRSWGLLAGAAYRFSETLTIGPGIGVFSNLEDDNSVFPILLIDWKITPDLSLETGRGLAATRGPGLQLRWRASPSWTVIGGGRYEKARFRLDDQGVAPRGIGEDRSVPLFVAAQYAIGRTVTVSALAGVDVAGRLRVEDARGNLLTASDYTNAPFLAFFVSLRL